MLKSFSIEELQKQMRDNLENQLSKLTQKDKDLLKKHCELTEMLDWNTNTFYTEPSQGVIYAYKIARNNDLRNLKNKLVRMGIGTYCDSIGLNIQFLDRI
jgi:hypothetical protein